jgi:hypothetical protein
VNEFKTTSAPAFASSRAMPRPMPEFDPVMIAVFPERLMTAFPLSSPGTQSAMLHLQRKRGTAE